MSRLPDDSQLVPTPLLDIPVEASTPFNQSSADIILKTSDHILFRVHSQILAQASPVFADMFELPQPERGSSSPPTIDVSENGETLDLLLRLLYPTPKKHLKMDDPAHLVPALKAAQKYEMALPVEAMSERLISIIPRDPLQVWAAACRTGIENIAFEAAAALKVSSRSTASQAAASRQDATEALAMMENLGDMNDISAADYLRLKRFLRAPQEQVNGGDLRLLSPLPSESKLSSIRQPPFSTDLPQTDVLCRSTRPGDAPQTILAHQAIIAVHSQTLRTRLVNLRADGSVGESLAGTLVLDFDDDPDVVSALLSACYEGFSGLPSSLGPLGRLLLAARKYEMRQIERMACMAWDELAEENPLTAFYTAVNHGLKEQAKSAAKSAFRRCTLDAYQPEMEHTSALAYHRLLTFYDSCLQVIRGQLRQGSDRLPVSTALALCGGQHYSSYQFASVNTNIMKNAIAGTSVSIGNIETISLGVRHALQQALQGSLTTCGNNHVTGGFRDLTSSVIELLTSLPEEVERAIHESEFELP
ncbi:hypothetical protein C8Q70DRAFT_1049747 [Cubamyces menziesii]|nr:hypothetical protein C8Q70DRAFT_1049747 [Cubamyces menziesii]